MNLNTTFFLLNQPNTMTIFKNPERAKQIDQLIRLKATGTPKELAEKIGVSERLLYYYLNEMKELGAPIYYDKERCCYCYSEEVKFEFGFRIIEQAQLDKIKGGEMQLFFLTADFLQ